MTFDKEGWQTVSGRRRGVGRGSLRFMKTDLALVSNVGTDGVLTSFFISNFLEHYWAKDLLAVFKTYGEAREVFIPPRRDNNGRRFGFVRF